MPACSCSWPEAALYVAVVVVVVVVVVVFAVAVNGLMGLKSCVEGASMYRLPAPAPFPSLSH